MPNIAHSFEVECLTDIDGRRLDGTANVTLRRFHSPRSCGVSRALAKKIKNALSSMG